jgi:hypothetical protein
LVFSDVRQPQSIGRIGNKTPLHQVLVHRLHRTVPLPAPAKDTLQPATAHEPGDALAPAADTLPHA